MHVLIAGASGGIGRALVKSLDPGYSLTVLGRSLRVLEKHFPQARIRKVTWETLAMLDAHEIDVVINLAGSNISGTRWTESVKQELVHSRTGTTARLHQWIRDCQAKPRYFSANAVGTYGMQPDGSPHTLDENSPLAGGAPGDILGMIGARWHEALQPLEGDIPVTELRFGVVLSRHSGMLKKLALPFNLGLGSVLGSGKQILSWIAMQDLVRAICFLLERPSLSGVFNLTSPHPVSQAEFARELAATLHRPLWLRIPAPCVRFLFGEMGECLLLHGQRVIPRRLQEAGFVFDFPLIEEALHHAFA